MRDLKRWIDALDTAAKFFERRDDMHLVATLEEIAEFLVALTETETGQRQWCVIHAAPVWNVASGECIGAHHLTPVVPCEIVPAYVIPATHVTGTDNP